MRCYWCIQQAKLKKIQAAETKIVGLPMLGIVVKGAATEGTMYFHRRECMVNWLNSEEGKQI